MVTHWLWLVMLQGITRRQKLELLKRFSDAEDLYCSEIAEGDPDYPPAVIQALSDKDLTRAHSLWLQCKEQGIRIITCQDPEYPRRLRNIDDPPLVLYCKGKIPDLDAQPVIGVVGTRKATATGKSSARDLSRELAACGALVVSGGAAGIDTEAHRGALDEDAPTVAVFGCGVDVVFPAANRRLFEQIEKKGCLISEYPPGTQARAWHFPERNRIISGLSHGILVVEAPEKSGALITARNAMEHGRDVFAVPGSVNSPVCAGSNALLREGAAPALSGWDMLKDYASQFPGVQQRQPVSKMPDLRLKAWFDDKPTALVCDKKAVDNFVSSAYSDQSGKAEGTDPLTQKLLDCLGADPVPVDDVIAAVQAPAAEVLSALTKMALLGKVLNHPGRMVSLKRK